LIGVAAQDGVPPDAAVIAQDHVANDCGVWSDPGIAADYRLLVSQRVNRHAFFLFDSNAYEQVSGL
jgi:hypothetical protein